MLMKSSSTCLFIFIFNLPLFEQASHQHRRYVHVALRLTWSLAQKHCREHHTDLATFQNSYDALQSPCSKDVCWIGLYRDDRNPKVWHWSNGEISNYTSWGLGEPNDYHGTENCVFMKSILWHDSPCNDLRGFLCYENSILVKENKTWEEALEHCRSLETDSSSSNRNHRFDLRSVASAGSDSDAILDAQTPEVWIGLRFLAGEWLWLNGMPLTEQLPACPAPGMYCGTMSKKGELWPMKNCSERRNFFCSISD